MKKQFFLVMSLLALVIVSMSGCTKVNGKGPVITELRSVSDFNEIEFGTSGRLYYRQAATQKVEIRAQQNILDVIESTVRDGELRLRIKNNTVLHSYEPIEIYVESPSIRGLKVKGSGDIRANEAINTDRLDAEISGSGSIDLHKLTCELVEADIEGSGNIVVRDGSATHGELEVEGSGDINLRDFRAATLKTRTSGSGNMWVWVTNELDARISGSGSVRYKGQPTVKVQISGSGKVSPY